MVTSKEIYGRAVTGQEMIKEKTFFKARENSENFILCQAKLNNFYRKVGGNEITLVNTADLKLLKAERNIRVTVISTIYGGCKLTLEATTRSVML